MITEDYVSFETAKLLKEKGFENSEPTCINVFKGHIYKIQDDKIIADDNITIPTLQMAMKWLREVHKILIVDALSMAVGGKLIYEKRILEFSPTPIGSCENPFNLIHEVIGNTPEKACEAAIRYCLENLI